jgi:hypothetical protein
MSGYLFNGLFIYLTNRPSILPFIYYQLAKRNGVQLNIMSRIIAFIKKGGLLSAEEPWLKFNILPP